MKEFLTKEDLKGAIGSFFTSHYDEEELLNGLLGGMSQQGRQLEQNLDEIRGCASVETTPEMHIENWYPLIMRLDRNTGSYTHLTYGELKAVYGEAGAKPIYDQIFNYGDTTSFKGVPPEGSQVEGVTLLTDSIDNPTIVLVDGIDYTLEAGKVVFHEDPLQNEGIRSSINIDLLEEEDVFLLWGYKVSFDLQYLARHWGYLVNFEKPSSKKYNQSLWALWRARYYGMSEALFIEMFSIYLNSPVVQSSGEEVVKTLSTDNGSVVVTTENVYHLDSQDTLAVSEGDLLNKGDNLGTRFKVMFPDSEVYAHNIPVDKFLVHATPPAQNQEVTVASYVVFEATKTPIEFVRNQIKYVSFTGDSGETLAPLINLNRFSARHWSMEIKETTFTGVNYQKAGIQFYDSEGSPLLVEPYSGGILPNLGSIYLYSDQESMAELWKDADKHQALIVRRILLIGLFPDQELEYLKNFIEGLRFTSGVYLGVDIVTSDAFLDVINEAATTEIGVHNSFKDYDLLVVDSLTGVTSTIDEEGQPGTPTPLLSSVQEDRIRAKIQKNIADLEEELLTLDVELMEALSHNYESAPNDLDTLYGICGILGTPSYSAPNGAAYYKVGKMSLLDIQKVVESESRNETGLKVPTSESYKDTYYKGKSSSSELTPVFTGDLIVDSTTPKLIQELDPKAEYVYSISKVEHVN